MFYVNRKNINSNFFLNFFKNNLLFFIDISQVSVIICVMSKRLLKGRKQIKGAGKLYGRSHGEMVFNDHVGRKVTPKLDESIKKNLEKRNK